MTKEVKEAIAAAADMCADKVIQRQRTGGGANLYRATERILYNYKQLKAQVADIEGYLAIPGKSGSITSAVTGGGYKDRDEMLEEQQKARAASYARTKAQLEEVEAAIRQFDSKEEFVVIRMYYFGETADGREAGKKYTFEEIQDELAQRGMERSERTIRGWRTRIVQDLTVILFGVNGAVSLEENRQEKATNVSD